MLLVAQALLENLPESHFSLLPLSCHLGVASRWNGEMNPQFPQDHCYPAAVGWLTGVALRTEVMGHSLGPPTWLTAKNMVMGSGAD